MNKTHAIYRYLLFLIIAIRLLPVSGQNSNIQHDEPCSRWVDSVMTTLSTDEMIGQLLVVRANYPGQPYIDVIDKYITNYNIGGVTFFGGHPTTEARQTNHWQSIAKTPLFIAIDGEWGPAMRLDSILAFPYQMTLGAISNDSLIYQMGLEVARQCKQLGVQMNFAPVVDINCNPDNPVIHMRSFGENPQDVSRKGLMYMKGMQDGGLIVTAKHFPGHGDTGTDSHYALPVIPHSRERLDSVEFYPYKQLIAEGLDGIMIAHLYVPSIEKSANTPSTLSNSIVTGILRNDLGFKGLIVTDALDMKAVTQNNVPGDIEVKALLAGNDILLLSANVPAAIIRIKAAIASGVLTEDLIRERCRQVLTYKYKAGLSKVETVNTKGLDGRLNTPATELLDRKLFEGSVTIVRNDGDLLPLTGLDTLKIASVSAGYDKTTPFQDRLACYAPVTSFSLKKEPAVDDIAAIKEKLKSFNMVIISIQNTTIWGGSPYGISDQVVKFVSEISKDKKVILDLFASPYSLRLFAGNPSLGAIVMSYQDHPLMQDISAQVIFGGIPASGRLPVTAGADFPYRTGFNTVAIRLKYTIPEELGIKRIDLLPVDSIIKESITKKVFPGCQVWAAKDGKVFFMGSFGNHTYDNDKPVKDSDLYDIASLTKIAASTLSVMRLTDEKKIDIDRQLQDYLPFLKNTNKGSIVIRSLMAHQARLKPWIPFYKYTLKDGRPDSTIYRNAISEDFPVRVAENLYIVKNYTDVIFDSIIASPLLKTNSYKYSDLGFYMMPRIIESLVNEPFDEYVDMTFYKPLGLSTMGFLPRQRFPLDRIVPTEDDKIFRGQLVHGDVHDPGAAMMGGVSGHAGLFSDANDLGVIGQMLLNKGTYGGKEYLTGATIDEFTERQYPLNDNRRGAGFDKPLPEYSSEGPCCKSASGSSYGHSGFTGTYIWVDPQNGLVYIFLSNRVYPDAENNKLASLNIRSKIHQVFYDAIGKSTTFAR
jgi:beta-glucosidase-like glycosyl hydrolase/CubicO group peptidase (beta-lactamase class C family)